MELTIKKKKELLKQLENKTFTKINLNYISKKDFVKEIKAFLLHNEVSKKEIKNNLIVNKKNIEFYNYIWVIPQEPETEKKVKIKCRSKDYIIKTKKDNIYCKYKYINYIDKNYIITKHNKLIRN